ncbi:hypothetical protein WJX81_007727 [Elliptochloris bilobata]|uniref:Non-specific serine/threonine protein kinase n=1 Tax=Elliptochloris bilobata TaxID=381761 RepID=A0AAW1RBC5_9CHLO
MTAGVPPPAAATVSAPEDVGAPLKLEHSLENLEILRTLGTGTFGRVRLVRCRLTGRYLALKALKKAEILRMRQERSVHNEKQILASLQHPFIVRMLTVFADKQRVYLLMEYVPGGELFKRLREAPGLRLGPAEARFYAAGVALALEYLHSSGVIYRDLKPENLLLDAAGYIKLTDFGFARELDEHSRSFTVCGTTEYMAPEMVRGTSYGFAADWWSFGVLVFEMLCGYAPFLGPNSAQVYKRIMAGSYTCPAHVDPQARDLIRRLLTTTPAARLGSPPGGPRDILLHPFFAGFPWEDLLQGRLPAPFVPALSAPGDARHFNTYTESVDEGDGGTAMLPGASTTLGEEAFRDFAVSRLITEDAIRHFHQRMKQVNG